jgi:uncharacterized membrane protein
MKNKTILGWLLVAATLISVAMVMIRIRYNGDYDFAFLIWNLLLAWIPYAAAWAAYLAERKRITFLVFMPLCTLVWLAFFPNAPYMLTDFVHLAQPGGATPLWFDVLMLVWAIFTGLLLGIASLKMMQQIIARTFSPAVGWVFVVASSMLSSLGIYLGRFLRWNSWNLLQDPLAIVKDVYDIVRHPITNFSVYVFMLFFTMLFLFIYVSLHLLDEKHVDAP